MRPRGAEPATYRPYRSPAATASKRRSAGGYQLAGWQRISLGAVGGAGTAGAVSTSTALLRRSRLRVRDAIYASRLLQRRRPD